MAHSRNRKLGGNGSDGRAFERLTAEVFATLVNAPIHAEVEHDVKLSGEDGERQIDVLISSKTGPISHRTVLECKDYGRRLTIEAVDALHSKMRDVRADKAGFVTRKGFSARAKRKADRLGIQLFTLNEARESAWEWIKSIPITVNEVSICEWSFECQFSQANWQSETAPSFNQSSMFEGGPIVIAEKFRGLFFAQKLPLFVGGIQTADLKKMLGIETVLDVTGNKHPIGELVCSYRIENQVFFGYMGEIPGCVALNDLESGVRTHMVSEEDVVMKYREFSKFSSVEECPTDPAIQLILLVCPDFSQIAGVGHFSEIYAP